MTKWSAEVVITVHSGALARPPVGAVVDLDQVCYTLLLGTIVALCHQVPGFEFKPQCSQGGII